MSRDNPSSRGCQPGATAGVLRRAGLCHLFGGRQPPPWGPLQPAHVATARQVHGRQVLVAKRRADLAALADAPADALVARAPAPPVGVWTADCVPLLAGEPGAQVVGAAHAGWRGAVAGVVAAWVAALVALGAGRARLRVALGPAIGPCCFRVGENVAQALAAAWAAASPASPDAEGGPLARPDGGGPRGNLWALCRRQLLAAGVAAAHIEVVGRCTVCCPELHSYRRDGAAAGRQLSAIVAGDALPFGGGGD